MDWRHFNCILLAACFLWPSLSYVHGQQVHEVFPITPTDSIRFNLDTVALPASDIELYYIVKANDNYYCLFHEYGHEPWYRLYHLMCFSQEREPFELTLPEFNRSPQTIFQRRDSLYYKIGNDGYDIKYYYLNPEDNSWIPYHASPSFIDTKYDDEEWAVRYISNGEFGEMMWFIDKLNSKEYAFSGLCGQVHRIDNLFYVVERSKIYEIDPLNGFLCDASTAYESASESYLAHTPFNETGYYEKAVKLSPIVEYDYSATLWSIESDTLIVGSFLADGKLHCIRKDSSGTFLTRLDDGNLRVHHKIFDYNSDYSFFKNCGKGTKLLLSKRQKGSYDLYEIGEEGNSLIRFSYEHGLNPVKEDGFETLLTFLLENWGHVHYQDIARIEESLGGKESLKNLAKDHNRVPPEEIFAPNDTYHINHLFKQINEDYIMASEYWVSDTDATISAAFFDWQDLDFFSNLFEESSDLKRIEQIVTKHCGPGTYYEYPDQRSGYNVQWVTENITITLDNSFHHRLLIY